MIKLIVEIIELEDGRSVTNIDFRTEEQHPTQRERFWESRLYPVLKEALDIRGLIGERGEKR